MTDELFKKIEHISDDIKYIEKVEDIDYIRVKNVEYGLQDRCNILSPYIEESKLMTKEQKIKEFRKIIPSYEQFKNLVIENKGYFKIEGMFEVDVMGYVYKPEDTNFYLKSLTIGPKYWDAGIDSIIYSYIEIFIKEMGYESIYIGASGLWKIINFFKREDFSPMGELDAEYIVPLLEALNTECIAVTDESGDIYIMPMHKYIGTGDIFAKIGIAIAPYVQAMKNDIAKSKDGYIRFLVKDITNVMVMTGLKIGMTGFENSVYWGLKYNLFLDGIVVTLGHTQDKEPVLVLRSRVESDVLPESLTDINR